MKNSLFRGKKANPPLKRVINNFNALGNADFFTMKNIISRGKNRKKVCFYQ